MARKSCSVSWVKGRLGWSAVAKKRGRVVNSINYRGASKPTQAERREAEHLLCDYNTAVDRLLKQKASCARFRSKKSKQRCIKGEF